MAEGNKVHRTKCEIGYARAKKYGIKTGFLSFCFYFLFPLRIVYGVITLVNLGSAFSDVPVSFLLIFFATATLVSALIAAIAFSPAFLKLMYAYTALDVIMVIYGSITQGFSIRDVIMVAISILILAYFIDRRLLFVKNTPEEEAELEDFIEESNLHKESSAHTTEEKTFSVLSESEQQEAALPQEEPDKTTCSVDHTPKATFTQKQKPCFCKYCGGEIDQVTKKCGKCGKQYFRFRKKLIFHCLSGAIFICMAGAIVYLDAENKSLSSSNDWLQDRYSAQKEIARKYEEDYWDIYFEYRFYNDAAVIVQSGGTAYHHYGCPRLDTSSFYIYNIESAAGRGYSPCPVCKEQQG